MQTIIRLTLTQLQMYYRDRQSVFLSLFFPLMMMFALGYMVNADVHPPAVALVGDATAAPNLVATLESSPLISIEQSDDADAREALKTGAVTLILELPDHEPAPDAPVAFKALVNAGNATGTAQTLALVKTVLHDYEYALRGDAPLFSITTEDVFSRHLRYVDFLVPGILAFMIMQLAVAGSGFNIVEYKRKGILKRLFVTPLKPLDFIIALIASRLVTILVQLAIMLGVAFLMFGIEIEGSLWLLAGFVVFGADHVPRHRLFARRHRQHPERGDDDRQFDPVPADLFRRRLFPARYPARLGADAGRAFAADLRLRCPAQHRQ